MYANTKASLKSFKIDHHVVLNGKYDNYGHYRAAWTCNSTMSQKQKKSSRSLWRVQGAVQGLSKIRQTSNLLSKKYILYSLQTSQWVLLYLLLQLPLSG